MASAPLYVQCAMGTATVLTVAIKPTAVSITLIALSCELAVLEIWMNGKVMDAFLPCHNSARLLSSCTKTLFILKLIMFSACQSYFVLWIDVIRLFE